jgi:hypothetical protein
VNGVRQDDNKNRRASHWLALLFFTMRFPRLALPPMSTPIVPVVVTIKSPESGNPNGAKVRAHRDDLDNRPWRRSLLDDPVALDNIP